MRYAILESGVVTNVAEWDGVTPWGPGDQAVQSDTAGIGDVYDGIVFTVPVVPEVLPDVTAAVTSPDAAAVAAVADDFTLATQGMTVEQQAAWRRLLKL